MPWWAGSSTMSDEEERAFLQRRLALFAKVAFLIALVGDLLDLATSPLHEALHVGAIGDRLATLTFAGMWLACARGTRSVRFLRSVEAVGLALVSLLVASMGRYLVLEIGQALTAGHAGADPGSPPLGTAVDAYVSNMVLLGGTVVFALRAALIPSPPRLTLAVTAILGLPFVLVPVLAVAPAADAWLVARPSSNPRDLVWGNAIWWTVVTVACTVISSVIYGLRRDVREARRLGQYTLEEKLGEGGMGVVHRASHALLRRPTAVKLLPPEKAGHESLERFEREVQLTATLTHANTVTIYDYGRTPDGVLYYAMELIEGPTLQEVVDKRGPQSPGRVVHILAQAAGALAEAHAAGLIHRDVKPANIMLCERGGVADVVKVLDFGLVKDVAQEADAVLTKADALTGTPHYMSPEAIRARDQVTAQSDVYALGAVGYFLVTGTTVFDGDSIVEVCSHHLHTEPTSPSERLGAPVPAALEELLLACLDKDPARRPTCDVEIPNRLQALAELEKWTAEDARAWWGAHRDQQWTKRSAAPLRELEPHPAPLFK